MRASAAGWAASSYEEALRLARESAEVSHNHPEGIKGAQAVAAVIWSARQNAGRQALRALLEEDFRYDCSGELEDCRRGGFDVTCQGTLPAAAVALFHADDFEAVVRNAVSFGGDTDTLACIAGAMAEAVFDGVPEKIQEAVYRRLDEPLRHEVAAFVTQYGVPVSEIFRRS